jgi:hypothetical protein
MRLMNTIAIAPALALALPLSAQVDKVPVDFQQCVDYTIAVRLDDVQHMLHGQETFTYTNNSPTALDTLWIHLWPNAYRDRNSALDEQLVRDGDLSLHFATDEERGHIDSLDFKSGTASLTWGYHPQHADIAWLKLPTALASGASTSISTPFRVKIPDSKFSRLGHTGQAYHVTQWYPKPAVFDKNGWHAMPYLTMGEFYSEFGKFDVSITLPANYVVGATGLLQDNPEEEAWMNERAGRAATADRSKEANAFPASEARTKTLRYVQDQVHDFAWFADKRFIVRKGSVTLERSGRAVTTWALFTPRNAKIWEEVGVTSLNESVRLYSKWVGDYPYDACTAVDGTISAGGGMEYPMITIIGNMGDVKGLDNVIAHEVGHNWFYGILGSNERDHPWMDEGMNSSVELRYMRVRYPNEKPGVGFPGEKKLLGHVTDGHRFQSEAIYRLNARRNLDQPIEECSAHYTQINYGGIVYSKTALVFDQLLAYLGEEAFDRCMHAYYDEWKFKHPQPEDVRRVFERESGKDLGWMFDELIGTTQKVDVKPVKLKGGLLYYRSNAQKGFPFPVTGWKDDVALGTVWIEGDQGKNSVQLPWNDADRVRIDTVARTLDIDRRNNEVRSHGLFRRCAEPEVKYLLGIEKNDRRSMYWTPLAAWNGHDGFQLGLAAYNTVFPSQSTEWVLAPLYGLGSERIGGAARIEHHFDRMNSRLFQNIHLGLSARSASTLHDHYADAWYTKLAPSIVFDLKRDPLSKPWQHSVTLRGVQLWQESRTNAPDAPSTSSSNEQWYAELSYRATNTSTLAPTEIIPTLTYNADFVRASLEVKQAFTYNKRKDQLRLRVFAGSILSRGDGFYDNALNAWGLSWGPEDLLFDQAYLERGADNGTLAQQFTKQQGAFKTPFQQGGSEDWMAAMNLELDLPIGLPLSLFASTGWVPTRTVEATSSGTITTNSIASYAEAGIGIQVIRDVLEVWMPLVVSSRIADEEEFLDRSFGQRIRFVFALERMDPTKALRRLKP